MAALLFSCKKDISKIGVDVVGENSLDVIIMDTITIRAHSVLIDTLRTDELSSHVVGVMMDPVFGLVNGSVYAQFSLTEAFENNPFGNLPQLDSIMMYVKYAKEEVYGDTAYMQNFTVYELGENMLIDTAYYSFSHLRTKSEILGELSIVPRFDTIDYYEENSDGVMDTLQKTRPLTIRLSDDLGNRLLGDTTLYSSNEKFREEFKGIYLTTLEQHLPSTGGGLVNLTFDDEKETYIEMFYHNDEEDSLSMTFGVNIATAHFSNYNHYDYQHADADFIRQLIDGDTTLGEQRIYMQGLAGVRTMIEFPYLSKIDDYYNYVINEAKLFVYNVDQETRLDPINQLTLSQQIMINEELDYYLVKDAGPTGGMNYFGGNYQHNDERYYFRITQYIQELIEGEAYDNRLRIEMIGGQVNPNRLLGGGWNPADLEGKQLKLQIIYTKIDDDE